MMQHFPTTRIKTLFLFSAFLFFSSLTFAQDNSVAIGSTTTKADAVLWLVPNGQQGLILPVTTRSGFVPSEKGMVIYDSSDNKVYYWNGTAWTEIGGGSGGGTDQTLTYNSATGELTISGSGSTVTLSINGDLTGNLNNVQIANGAVTTTEILDGTVALADLTTVGAANGDILQFNGTAWTIVPNSGGTAYTAGTGINVTGTVITNTGDTDATDDLALTTVPNAAGDISGDFNSGLTINANAVTSAEIADGTIVNVDISDVAASKATVTPTGNLASTDVQSALVELQTDIDGAVGLPATTDAQIIVSNGTTPTGTTMSGDATISNTGVVTIAANAITSTEITDATIVDADISDVTASKATVTPTGNLASTDVQSALVELQTDIDGAVGLPATTDSQIIVSSGTTPTGATMSGDATISNTGVVTITDGAISGGVGGKITDLSITADDITANTITTGKIAPNGTTRSLLATTTAGIVNWVAPTGDNQVLGSNGAGDLVFRPVVDAATGIADPGTDANLVTEAAVRAAISGSTSLQSAYNGGNAIQLAAADNISITKNDASSLLYLDEATGRVGVGISTPESNLHVLSNSGSQLKVGHPNQPAREWIFGVDAVADFTIKNETSGEALRISSANAVTIPNLGVGIVTADATGLLSSGALTSADIPNLDAAKITTGILPVARGGTGTSSFGANAVIFSDGTNLIGDETGLSFTNSTNALNVGGDTYFRDINTTGTTLVSIENSGTNGWLRVYTNGAGDGQIYPAGQTFLRQTTTTTTPQFSIQNSGTGDVGMRFTGQAQTITMGVDNSDLDKFKISDNTTLGTNDRLVIETTGHIGINTPDPTSQLEITTADQTALEVSGSNTWGTALNLYNSSSGSTWRVITAGSAHPDLPSGSLGIGDALGNYGFIMNGSNLTTYLAESTSSKVALGFIPTATTTYKLELPNNTTAGIGRARANAWVTYSDTRVKYNQTEIHYGLKELLLLKPKFYHHHSSNVEGNEIIVNKNDYSEEIGFVAQEVYEVIPEIVSKPENEQIDLWSMDYEKLTPVIVKAIQELNPKVELNDDNVKKLLIIYQELVSRIESQQSEINQFKAENKEAKANYDELRSEVNLIKELLSIEAKKKD
ncbi:MAG: tail fiber domain-containing protein [Cyclobacteriaceae bacterium]|nr:tail fiber domain-containing protein [Cyclobacteriaceae bacterium]